MCWSGLWAQCGFSRTGLVSTRPTAPAQLPPSGIVGLESRWSRIVKTPSSDGVERDWHLLDSWAETSRGQPPELTLLCVHGNPSWSFLWRELITQIEDTLGDKVRVVAVDQLDMGFSERTGQKRTLRTRVNDLCDLTEAMNITGPVITVAHDWGGPISLGWALRHHDGSSSSSTTPARPVASSGKPVLAGVVLSNTAVHQPAASPAPSVIRFIRIPALLRTITVHSRAFIHGAIEMSRPRLPAAVRSGFMAPYRQASKRSAIADFVADIPLDKEHQSASTLDEIATGLETIRSLPALLLWGPRDKVFSDLYLHDLEQRLPQAQVHRFPGAAHFVGEDANVSAAIVQWLEHQFSHLQADQDLPENNNTSRETDVQSSSLSASEQRSTTDSRSRRALSDFSLAHPDSKAIVEANIAGYRSGTGRLRLLATRRHACIGGFWSWASRNAACVARGKSEMANWN